MIWAWVREGSDRVVRVAVFVEWGEGEEGGRIQQNLGYGDGEGSGDGKIASGGGRGRSRRRARAATAPCRLSNSEFARSLVSRFCTVGAGEGGCEGREGSHHHCQSLR